MIWRSTGTKKEALPEIPVSDADPPEEDSPVAFLDVDDWAESGRRRKKEQRMSSLLL